jgi:Ca2+-binding RTX toxin-like protein
MPSYTLEIEAFGVYATNMPSLEIWEDGVLDSTHAISSSGSTISVIISYGGSVPTSLSFTFNDAFAAAGRTIEIRSVKINDQHVNVGNYLSSDSLVKSASATVDVASSEFLFDATDPALSNFTVGATRTLTAGADNVREFTGTSDEVFNALGGRDTIYLGSGNDRVFGAEGDDVIYSGAGNDLISGGDDNDRIYGQDGDDQLYGGLGNDRIHGGNDDDEIHGGAGDDRLNGNSGNDVITGGVGADKLHGAMGDDILYGGADDDTLIGGNGADTLDGGSGADVLFGGIGNDTLNGGDGADIIIGNSGADIIHGDAGNDTIYVANGDFVAGEIIRGGTGTDELILTNAMTVDFRIGVLETVETLTGSDANQDVTMSIIQFSGFSTINYGLGTDAQTISIVGTNDVTALTTPTVSGLESSSIVASAGVDNLTITGAQFDSFTTGLTTLNFLGGADVLNVTSTSANLNTYGSNDGNLLGLETIDASGAGSGVTISMSAQTEVFTLTGSGFNDTLIGGSAADNITGGNGNDILTGLGGNDTIDGGIGNDVILGGDGNDAITGGAGDDTIYGATIIGESGIETVTQTDGSTWFTVTFSAAILNPVVKMSNLTNNDTDRTTPGTTVNDPYTVRVRDLTETGFQFQLDEFDYLDGSRSVADSVSWLAVSEGTHTLDNGSIIQAGRANVTNEAQTTVIFDSAFGSTPIVLSQVITDNDSAAVVTRNRSVSTTGFNVNLLEEEGTDNLHATEEIGYIAIEEGGSAASGFLIGQTSPTLVTHNVTTINFGGTFANAPVFVHDQQTVNGGDTSYSQADGITTTAADVFIGEEQAANTEVSHGGAESVGYFALNEGLLTSAGGGDNILSGGAGLDTLYGGDGTDTFIFEAVSAFLDRDILADFSAGEGDILDVSDLITTFSGTITDHVFFDDSSGTDTVVQIDIDGAGGVGFQDVAIINGITGLDEATLYANGNIVV